MAARNNRKILIAFSVLFFLAAACSLPVAPQQATLPAETRVAKTVEFMMTRVAGSGETATPQIIAATATTGAGEPTLRPSSTPQPTATRIVLPSATETEICDMASFITDVTVSDGSVLAAGATFTKTWRLRNNGACSWTPDYALVFESGDPMDGPASQRLGAYAERFYVDIRVVTPPASGAGYDFAANLCLAQWTGNGKTLPCIGKDNTAEGFVLYQPRPVLETGYVDDEPGLLTNPPYQADGVIRGKYPAYTVKDNDRFHSIVGCEHNAKNCNVRFQLDYQIDNGSIQTLGSWGETYDNNFTVVDVDLDSLAGKNVAFILTVYANGASDQDRALWLLPRIAQPVPTPTPTVTRTPTVTPTISAYPYP